MGHVSRNYDVAFFPFVPALRGTLGPLLLAPFSRSAGDDKAAVRRCILACATFLIFATAATAAPHDPIEDCHKVITENAFEAAGEKLVVTTLPDFASFPEGFLQNCSGNISMHLVVKEDGSVAGRGLDHGVACGVKGWNPDAIFKSVAWHDNIVLARVLKMRYFPPSLADRPICVTIERGWVPETPNRLWSPEEWMRRR